MPFLLFLLGACNSSNAGVLSFAAPAALLLDQLVLALQLATQRLKLPLSNPDLAQLVDGNGVLAPAAAGGRGGTGRSVKNVRGKDLGRNIWAR